MKHYLVYYRNNRSPKEVFATHYVPQGGSYVFFNPSGYGFESIPVYLVDRIEEVE